MPGKNCEKMHWAGQHCSRNYDAGVREGCTSCYAGVAEDCYLVGEGLWLCSHSTVVAGITGVPGLTIGSNR